MSRIAAILPAAGMGTRMGAETPKQFLELNGTPIVILSLRRIASCPLVTDLIVATRGDEVQRLEERIAKEKFKQSVRVVKGGDYRHRSPRARGAGADAAGLCHEASQGSVCPRAIRWCERLGRSRSRRAHRSRCARGARFRTQHENHQACRHGTRPLLPRTRGAKGMSTRCGIGYDLHRLAEGRKLIVGGIELQFDKGPVGHSDGDVLSHALCDALLGAAGLGDIGTHFPDTDPQWKGANSLLFLEHAKKLLADKNFAIEHVDAVVITEKPKLGPHFPKMREALAKALGVSPDKVHLKAKTNEGVDAIGRGEAIAAHVVATLSSR